MPARTIALEPQQTYCKLKDSLIEKECVILSEDAPKQLAVRQGSLWGVSPKTAKKTIKFNLHPEESKTRVEYTSKLAQDWTSITLIGCFLAAILTAVCMWMAVDLSSFLIDGNPGFWSWLVTVQNQVEFSAGEAFVNLAWGLSVFLLVIIALEIVVFFNCRSKIEAFAEEALNHSI